MLYTPIKPFTIKELGIKLHPYNRLKYEKGKLEVYNLMATHRIKFINGECFKLAPQKFEKYLPMLRRP